MTVCTCLWSPVGTTTLDPPYLVSRNADCPIHGGQDLIYSDLMAGCCSHTQAIDRLMECEGHTETEAIEIVAQWVEETDLSRRSSESVGG